MDDYHDQLISLHVSFLSRRTNFKVNEIFLRQEFSRFGDVQDCVVKQHCSTPASGSPRQYGYAFIYFADMPSSQRALDRLQREPLMSAVKYTCNLSHTEHNHSQHHCTQSPSALSHSPPNPSYPPTPLLHLEGSLPPNAALNQHPIQSANTPSPKLDTQRMNFAASHLIQVVQPRLSIASPSIPMHSTACLQAASIKNFPQSHQLGHPQQHSTLSMASPSSNSTLAIHYTEFRNNPAPAPLPYCPQNALAPNVNAGHMQSYPMISAPISPQPLCEYPANVGTNQGVYMYATPHPFLATIAGTYIPNAMSMPVAAVPIPLMPSNSHTYPILTGNTSNVPVNRHHYSTLMSSLPQQHPQQHPNYFFLR
jgi:RNA recognition motif-containing protein